jgi:4-diphosphocytidyl-2-C-methyl-D-erythritol kinase
MSRRLPVRLRIRAAAKINLTLRVLGPRPDGYHDLRTTFQSLTLHDTLTFRAVPGPFTIECTDPRCPTDRQNLIWRAADALWRAADRRGAPSDVHVRLKKEIPIEAGLGGGSSDAAAALRALTRLWRIRMDEGRLRLIAQGLGADVPFFFEGGTALGVDRGDNLFPLIDRPPAWVVLAIPDFGVSTRQAYEWWDDDHGAEGSRIDIGNDLQAPVSRRHPAISLAVRHLWRAGAMHAAMSGSGSAVFGLFPRELAARAAARAIASRRLPTILTRTLSRRRYRTFSRPW